MLNGRPFARRATVVTSTVGLAVALAGGLALTSSHVPSFNRVRAQTSSATLDLAHSRSAGGATGMTGIASSDIGDADVAGAKAVRARTLLAAPSLLTANRSTNTSSTSASSAPSASRVVPATSISGGGSAPSAAPAAPAANGSLLVGARSSDTSFASMNTLIGPIAVTRAFYPGTLPATFKQGGVSNGVKIIVSYKTASANTAKYVKSIPAGANVELVFHHEPEGAGDYSGVASVAGATFVRAFDAEAAIIHGANPTARIAFAAGGYQYQGGHGGSRGIGGSFIPSHADAYYLDSYQRTTIIPAQTDPRVQNYLHELAKKGHQFNGFTEYGRGVIASGAGFNPAVAKARANVIRLDATYLATLPSVNVWTYWFTTDKASGDQWRFTDAASISAWKTVERANAL